MNQELLKATSLPQHLIYFLFSSNQQTPLTWPCKYAVLELFDHSLSTQEAVVNLILTTSVWINESFVNPMEYLFNLIDHSHTTEFGTAVVLCVLRIATDRLAYAWLFP